MPFTVEDGTGLSNSNAYVSVAYADDYHSLRMNTAWTGTDQVKQAAIIKASEYVNRRFSRMFPGNALNSEQAMPWPRYSAYNSYGELLKPLPSALLDAVCEYAVRALLNGVLAPDPLSLIPAQSLTSGSTRTGSTVSGPLVEKRIKAGPVETVKRYDSAASQQAPAPGLNIPGGQVPSYPEADMLMASITVVPANTTVRA